MYRSGKPRDYEVPLDDLVEAAYIHRLDRGLNTAFRDIAVAPKPEACSTCSTGTPSSGRRMRSPHLLRRPVVIAFEEDAIRT